jgi:hypothetical protein
MSQRVTEIFEDCLTSDPESVTALKIEGIIHNAVFDRAKLADYHTEIGELLSELPEPFQPADQGGGGGWSFLNACDDKHGNQWTGFHLVMEQLFLLGIATGQASVPMPRDLWSILPGGMPYVSVHPVPVGST